MSYLDKTFCASPNCKNDCGRKMTESEKEQYKKFFVDTGFVMPVSYGYFCGKEQEKDNSSLVQWQNGGLLIRMSQVRVLEEEPVSRGSSEVERQVHTLEARGSIPFPATKLSQPRLMAERVQRLTHMRRSARSAVREDWSG